MNTVRLQLRRILVLCSFFVLISISSHSWAQGEKQIKIETKFVEVTQQSLEELGFDWLFNSGGGSFFGTPGSSRGGNVDGTYNFPNITTGSSGSGVRINRGVPGILSPSGVFTDPQFQVILRALSEKDGIDLLSAPSVVTGAGQRAKIEIIREMIYPTEYDPPEIPQEFSSFFNPGETVIKLGGGAVFGDGTEIGGENFQQNNNNQLVQGTSNKAIAGFTHYLSNNLGVGGQFEWIDGNNGDAYIGQAEVTYRVPMDFKNFGLAAYLKGGVGGISADGIDEVIGSIGAGLEFRPQPNMGIFTGYSHNFLGNGTEFAQVVGGVSLVVGKGSNPSRRGGGGVKLEVVPTVSQGKVRMNMSLKPEVTEFEGFINYGSPISTGGNSRNGGNPDGTVAQGGTDDVGNGRVLPPIGEVRKVQTGVTINDGETVVLGGVIEDPKVGKKGKVPILGDLPIIGGLFRSQTEVAHKRNLIIFVKARLIDPSGDR